MGHNTIPHTQKIIIVITAAKRIYGEREKRNIFHENRKIRFFFYFIDVVKLKDFYLFYFVFVVVWTLKKIHHISSHIHAHTLT